MNKLMENLSKALSPDEYKPKDGEVKAEDAPKKVKFKKKLRRKVRKDKDNNAARAAVKVPSNGPKSN